MYLIIFTSIISNVYCHTPKNNSELIVTYEGHSEIDNGKPIFIEHSLPGMSHGKEVGELVTKVDGAVKTEGYVTAEDVVFIPNDKPVVRNEDLYGDEVRINDVLSRKYIKNVLEEKQVNAGTESPNEDIVFISGKNQENDDEDIKSKKTKTKKKETFGLAPEVEVVKSKKLNCSNLDCDVIQQPICGGKREQHKWKYRLFLNECFFRRVNCGFRHHANTYKEFDMKKCKDVAALNFERPNVTYPRPRPRFVTYQPEIVQNDTRRSFASRRSLNMGVDGQFCSHACPISCTDEYDPQCAVTGNGQKRVFLNHCKLDYNSCLYKIVWHQRPLSWCVGGRMADMRQNRGFIAWMQRTGVVDRKGRLMLS